MPIQRKGTPPTSKGVKHHNVLGALSAWTDNDADGADVDADKEKKKGAYTLIEDADTPVTKCDRFKAAFDVEADGFNMFIGFIIIANAALIGVETEYGRGPFIVFEHIFNSVFCLEMVLRVFQLSPKVYFTTPWLLFDFSLVLTGSLDLWILPIFTSGASGTSTVGTKLSVLRALRIVRLMRVLRVIRLFRMFQQLYLIMQAFHKAFQVVLLISILVMILDYVCAILLTQGVGHCSEKWEDPADQEKILIWFGTIGRSMQSLFVVMTLSNWDRMVLTLIKVYPASMIIGFFVLYIMITSYTMLSLITAIITDSLVTSQQEYKSRKLQSAEETKRDIQSELCEYLAEVHEDELDATGSVEVADLKTSVKGDQELLGKLASIGIMISEKGLSNLLDKISHDGKDRVRTSYFVDLLCNLSGPATASSVVDAKHEAQNLQYKWRDFEKKFDLLTAKMYPQDQASFLPKPKEGPTPVVVKVSDNAPPPKRSSLRMAEPLAPKVKKNMSFSPQFVDN